MLILRTVIVIGVLMSVATSSPAQDYSIPGPFAAGTMTVTVSRPSGTTFTARMTYPAAAAGTSTPFADAAAPAPAIAFGHGFLQATSQYVSTMNHLASWGFIVIASNSETGLLPSHANFAADLRHALTYIEQQNAAAGGFLYQKADVNRFGISGHSMGGGASILAAADDGRIKAVANLAAAETNPSAVSAMARVGVPIALIAGDTDSIVPVGSHGQLMFNAGRAPRMLPIIRGGFHCGFTDAGFLFCDSSPTLTRGEQLAITRRVLTQFFLLTLKDRQDVWESIWGPAGAADTIVNFAQSDPGVSMVPGLLQLSGAPGAMVTGSLTLTNTGNVLRNFDLLAESASGGSTVVNLDPSSVLAVAPGESRNVNVIVAVPPQGGSDPFEAVVSARLQSDGSTRGYAVVRLIPRCPSDFTGDGAVDGDDVIAFFVAWDAGDIAADFNGDQSVDGDDVIGFFAGWDAGC